MKLVPFAPEHFATLAGWFPSQAAIVQWGGPQLLYPLDQTQMQAMLAEGTSNLPARLCWMAALDEEIIGHAQLAFDWRNGNVTLGRVAIAPELRGRGYAVPMLELFLAEAFRYPRIMRLELNVYTFNTAAIRTYERLGFVHEGTRRSSAAVGEERWDTQIMAILRSEYQSKS
jgi:RimJ/RimL family protein N-acetyltransferase